jgi:hypothetical protein
METLNNFMRDASRLFDEMCEWITNKLNNDDRNNVTLLPQHIYDIYYHFKLLKKDGHLKYIQLGQLELDFFEIIINRSPYIIEVYKQDNKICTNLYFENEPFGEDFYTEHETYESIDNEISYISDYLDEMKEL